ncbi:MAG: DVU_1551 family NTP transferase [Desulfovibrionaceae bacterium]
MSSAPALAAVIPAAGRSSRMRLKDEDRPKPLLPLGETSMLGHCVATCRAAGVTEVVVVTGYRADEVAAEAERLGARPVFNPDHERGMSGSVRTGFAALGPEADAAFLLPADIPLVRPATLGLLLEDFAAHAAPLTQPRFRGEPGHPPLVAREVFAAILDADLATDGSLRPTLERFAPRARQVDTADSGVLFDLDRPEDYAETRARAAAPGPRPEEAEALWDIYATPENIRAHCRAVAEVAGRMAGALPWLDAGLCIGAALAHDVLRHTPRHALAGAAALRRHGFDAAAAVVADHPDLELAPDAPLTEREIVFLADKFVRGDQIVGLEQRYMAKARKFRDDPEAAAAVAARLGRATTVLRRFEREAGPLRRILPELAEACP